LIHDPDDGSGIQKQKYSELNWIPALRSAAAGMTSPVVVLITLKNFVGFAINSDFVMPDLIRHPEMFLSGFLLTKLCRNAKKDV
jgi:hypothetical protein